MSGAGRTCDGLLHDERRRVGGRDWFARVSAEPAPLGAPPAVLIHGLGVSSRYMVPTARCLAPHYPTLAPDLPGFGRSEPPDRALGVADMADALGGWLRARDLPPAVLVANSLGCQVAVDLSIRHPDLVGWLLLIGPSGDPNLNGSVVRWIGRLALDLPRERPAMVVVEAVDYLRAGPRRLFATARAMVRDPFLANLGRVAHPTLVLRGERDPICPQGWGERIAEVVPGARLEVVVGAAHVVNDSHPRVVLDAVRALLADEAAGSVVSGRPVAARSPAGQADPAAPLRPRPAALATASESIAGGLRRS